MSRIVLFPLLLVWACSDPNASTPAAVQQPFWPQQPCQPRSGEFRLRWVERGGNCGVIGDQLLDESSQAGAALCEGQQVVSDDLCQITTDATCPAAAPGFFTRIVGEVFWNTEGTEGVGRDMKVYVLNKAGQKECEGVYDVFYSKRLGKGEVCGVNCEPYSPRPCGAGLLEVCASVGTAYTTCSVEAEGRPPFVSICASGLSCTGGTGDNTDGNSVRCQ